jgi:dTDP-4-dehydrorhamnose 3,5-epimerase
MEPEMIDVGIAGVRLMPLTTHGDLRGTVTEMYRRNWIPEAREGLQVNLSTSHAGVLRGLHLHRRQADHWVFFEGTAFVGLIDIRAGSPTESKPAEITLDTSEGLKALYIPKGVAHGFYAETDLKLQYVVDEYFTGEDEFGIAWDDPGLGIEWPGRDPIVSERDKRNPSLEEVLRDPPPYEES